MITSDQDSRTLLTHIHQNLEVMSHVVNLAKPVDLTGKVVRESGFASHGGGYADIFTGTYHRDAKLPTKVAIKVIRTQIYNDSNQEIMGKVGEFSIPYVDRH